MPLIDMEFISNTMAKMEETVLWTNPSPTSQFSEQDVTLSDNINNYDYIAVDFNKNYTTVGSVIVMGKSYYKVSEYKQFKNAADSKCGICGFTEQNSLFIMREFWYKSDTQLHFYTAHESSGGSYPGWVVPLHIYGCKVVPKFDLGIKDFELYTGSNGATSPWTIPTSKKAKGFNLTYYSSSAGSLVTIECVDGENDNKIKTTLGGSYYDSYKPLVTFNDSNISIAESIGGNVSWQGYIYY